MLLGDLLGVGPGRVGVRVVGLEGDVVDADLVERCAGRGGPGRSSRRPGGGSRSRAAPGRSSCHAAPGPVLVPDVVGPLEDVGQPADLALRVGELEVREADEDAGEQEVAQRRHGVAEAERRRRRRPARRPTWPASSTTSRCACRRRSRSRRRPRRTGPSSRCGCSAGPRWAGISLKQTARTPRSALRRTSAAASSASQSGMMQSGMSRRRSRRTTPRPSSRCRPCTQARPSSWSLASVKVWPQKRGKVGKHSDASTQLRSMSSSAGLRVVAARAASRRR